MGTHDLWSMAQRRTRVIARHIAPAICSGSDAKKREEELLVRLAKDDDSAVSELLQLWCEEQGPEAKELILDGTAMMERGELKEATALFRVLCKQYPTWAEAWNKLATVMFTSGNLEESKQACEKALELKPQHFGALAGLVQISLGLQDATGVVVSLQQLANVHPAGARQAMEGIRQLVQHAHPDLKTDTVVHQEDIN